MVLADKTIEILGQFEIDSDNGFLPSRSLIDQLPDRYRPWDELHAKMTDAIQKGEFLSLADGMSLIEVGPLSKRESERAMLILGTFAHAYLHLSPGNEIPIQIAKPWVEIAERLQRVPIIAHSDLVLQNWKLRDITHPFNLDNLKTQFSFTGTLSESWFYLVTSNVEKVGAPAIKMVLESIYFANAGLYDRAVAILQDVHGVIIQLVQALVRMYENCDPEVFFNQIRPFLDSFIDVKYVGVNPEIRSYSGGSAAQSSLLQFFDMALGVDYGSNPSSEFLMTMRDYMPKAHREFLLFVQNDYNLKHARTENESLNEICKEIVQVLIQFRNEHLKMVAHYIVRPARKNNSEITGTGGTNPTIFLKNVRNINREHCENS